MTSSAYGPQLTSRGPLQHQYDELQQAWTMASESLIASRHADSHWVGGLSTSALSTATAVSALVQVRQHHCVEEVRRPVVDVAIADGCEWLAGHQNIDGGFGDTDRSHSNIATTLLVLAAWELAGQDDQVFAGHVVEQQRRAWQYVEDQGSWEGLRRRYGKDKTFVVPILSNCALAGLVSWSEVAALPFEAAWLPQELYRWARMPVVSYAVPALVAIGQARFYQLPPRNPLLRRLRSRALGPTLAVLRKMQPASGGYLEAVPLTSFVLMNLAAVGNGSLPVSQDCIRFILDSRLEDGSWPIDTNLATWLTSLSITAFSRRGPMGMQPKQGTAKQGTTKQGATKQGATKQGTAEQGTAEQGTAKQGTAKQSCGHGPPVSAQVVRWLLSCQHMRRHPFTGATPGGWGWTNLSGAVPDADDTPAALLALAALDLEDPQWARLKHQVAVAAGAGLRWLLRLQNRDGGWPTFCRGWGTLPFDRSGTDLTAHALRAFQAWQPRLEELRGVQRLAPSQAELQRATRPGLRYLARNQRSDGSWLPLWFGNQDRTEEDNPIYGTGKVLLAYVDLQICEAPQALRGVACLRNSQNPDGGWGGGPSVSYDKPPSLSDPAGNRSSVEESAIALEALLQCGGDPRQDATIMRGLRWLTTAVRQGACRRATPIGFYFAKLWYYEQLYPTIFSLSAIGTALRKLDDNLEELPRPGGEVLPG